MIKDFQKSKVYRWESYLETGGHIEYENIQEYVNFVWEKMGLEFPPKVKPMPKQNKTAYADATRTTIRFNECGSPKRIVLHEIAHSMTSSFDGKSHRHNDVFVGMYMTLMNRFMNISLNMLYQSADLCNVKYMKDVLPRIVDGNELYI